MSGKQRTILNFTLVAAAMLICFGCDFFHSDPPITTLDFKGTVVDTSGNAIPGIAIQPFERYNLPDSIKNDTVKDPSGLAKTITYTDSKGAFQLRDQVYSGNSFYYRLVALDVDGEANGRFEMAVDTLLITTVPGATGSFSMQDIEIVMKPKN